MLDFLGTHPIIKYKDILEAALGVICKTEVGSLFFMLYWWDPMGFENSVNHAFVHWTIVYWVPTVWQDPY